MYYLELELLVIVISEYWLYLDGLFLHILFDDAYPSIRKYKQICMKRILKGKYDTWRYLFLLNIYSTYFS
jgi:hypothetical protein